MRPSSRPRPAAAAEHRRLPDRSAPSNPSNPSNPANPRGHLRRLAHRIDWADDSGMVGGVEVIPFGLLIFVVGSLLVVQAWAVVDVKFAADAAAREGVRTFVEAPDEATAIEAGRVAAADAIAGHGRDEARLTVDPPAYGGGSFARCAPVTVTVHYPVPAITLPWIGGQGDGFVVTARHTEIIDPYRSELAAGGGC